MKTRVISKTSNYKNNNGNLIILPDVDNIELGMYLIEQDFNDLGGRTLPSLITEVSYQRTNVINKLSNSNNDEGNEITLSNIEDLVVGMFLTEQSNHVSVNINGTNISGSNEITSISQTDLNNLKTGMYLYDDLSGSNINTGITIIEKNRIFK